MNHRGAYFIIYCFISHFCLCVYLNPKVYSLNSPTFISNSTDTPCTSHISATKNVIPTQNDGILLVDATGLAYRCFFGMPALRTHMGYEIGCLYGFLNSLSFIIRSLNPKYIGLAFDSPDASQAKRKIWPKYKVHRKKTPQELVDQIGYIKDYCEISGIPILYYPETEADDLIATSLYQLNFSNYINIVTSDKDLFQLLVHDNITIIQPQKQYRHVDFNVVIKEYGITPDRFAEYLALVGDASDGIPGVLGIGPKTAPKLIAEHSTFDDILNCQLVQKIKDKGGKYSESVEMAWNFYNLTKLNQEIPIEASLESLELGNPLEKQLEDFYKKFSIRKHAYKWAVLQKSPVGLY